MKPDLIESVHKASLFIETNLKRKLTLGEIAAEANLSKFHLHRILSRAAGRPLIDYVRARKLADSLEMLLGSSYTILHIAQEFGFEYEQTYIRAFVSEYGMTPSKFRRGSASVKVTEKINLSLLHNLPGGILFEAGFRFKPAFHLIGIRHYFSPEVNGSQHTASKAGNDFYYRHKSSVRNSVHPETYIGFTKWIEGDADSNSYLPSIEVTSLDPIPAGMSSESVPAHKYAVFHYTGHVHPSRLNYSHLKDIWSYILHDWFPHSGFVRAEPFFYESIDVSISAENYCEVDLYVPVTQ